MALIGTIFSLFTEKDCSSFTSFSTTEGAPWIFIFGLKNIIKSSF